MGYETDEAALAAAQAQPPGLVVFIPYGASEELREALEGLAAETGRQVLHGAAPPRSPAIEAAIGHQARDVPEIERDDNRGFLKNLEKIARGDMRVRS